MTRIFISYRRDDSAGYAGRLADALEQRFGAGNVFRDVDDIAPGEDFVQRLHAALAECDLMIPVIGPLWLSSADAQGKHRLDDPEDYVRLEIGTALQRGLRVIPVLVDGAGMPRADDLPKAISALPRRQALMLTDGTWDRDVERLCQALGGGSNSAPNADVEAGRPRRIRRSLVLATFGVVALTAVGAGAWLALRPPDLSGRWQSPDGSQWLVRQSGREVQIEEVHYESREVWRKGSGRITDDRLEVELRYVFQPDTKLEGALQLARDKRSLSGALLETPGGRRVGIDLRR